MQKHPLALLIVVLVCAFAAAGAAAQSTAHAPGDSSAIAVKDTTQKADTVSGDDVDSIVTYKANDTIQYHIQKRIMHLVGKSEVHYEGQDLNAEIIDVNFLTSILNGYGRSDSGGKSMLGTPVFNDRGELYNGAAMSYNFKTKRGNVTLAKTKIDEGLYFGDVIKRESEDVMFVKDGKYTTCDLPHPHYYFYSPKMKVILRDRVFAEPVVLYVEDVPLFAIPFGVFPNKSGRQSGIIVPGYGQETSRGFFLQHLGYFWAINDYADIAATTDLYTKGSSVFNTKLRYALRYDFSGSITASYARTRFNPDDPIGTQWSLGIQHQQTIDPTTNLDANLQFESPNYLRTTSTNVNDLLQATIYSNASFATSWEHSSLSMNYERTQYLANNNINESPTLSYTLQQFYPFRSDNTTPGNEQWYELIGIAYSGNAKAVHNTTNDSLGMTSVLQYGVQHSPTVNFTPKVGYFSVTPSFTYSETWYPERVEQYMNPGDSAVRTRTDHGFYRVWSYSAGISASTRLYGIVQPGIFGITALRHTLTPSVSFSYQPDFSSPNYNFYGSYYDYLTRTSVRYSYFQNEIFGGPGAGLQKSVGLSLDNNFEMKVHNTDTTDTKVQLLTAALSTSYNFAADSFNLAPIQLTAHTSVLNALQLQGAASFTPYYYSADSGRYLSKFKWQMHDGLVNTTSFSFNMSTTFDLMKSKNAKADTSKRDESFFRSEDSSAEKHPWAHFMGDDGAGNMPAKTPLSLTLGYSFVQVQPVPHQISSRSSGLNASLTMQVTPTWSLTTTGFYDFVSRTFQIPSVNISKDLHDWILNFIWYPTDPYLRGFYLELRLKAPQLQDVKITKRDNVNGLY